MDKTVSFVIPTFNSERTLEASLKSFSEQTYPHEIIIVDGGSTDKTIEIAKKYADTVILHKRDTRGKARFDGVNVSNGKILALFDSDIYLPRNDWLEKNIRLFEEGTGIVWIINTAPPNSSRITRYFWNFWGEQIKHRIKIGKAIGQIGNSLFLKEAILDAGNFDPKLDFGDDTDMGLRIVAKGWKVKLSEDAFYHDTLDSLTHFTRKQLRDGRDVVNYGIEKVLGLSLQEALYEQFVVPLKGMVKGLAEKEISWLLFPLLFMIRLYVYSGFYLRRKF